MRIDVDPDRVTIEGQEVRRPDHISPAEWMEFWERVKRLAR